MLQNQSSFRDPGGYVLEDHNDVYRIILPPYETDWRELKASNFLDKAKASGLLPFVELNKNDWPESIPDDAIGLLKSEKIPFITYPYEWCFSQLKEAALLTLDLQILALDNGFTLKDASAYNIQFIKGKATFIDLLSFERRMKDKPWEAYGQFCSHFLAPLALMSLSDERLSLLSQLWVDGIPIDLASKLLPIYSKLSPGLAIHLHMHGSMCKKYAETGIKKPHKQEWTLMSARQVKDVCQSLRHCVEKLKSPRHKSEWVDYYEDTNYSQSARKSKENLLARLAGQNGGEIAMDLGANTGEFSRIIAPFFALTIASDLDHGAVEKHWSSYRQNNILPLVLDLANPSPSIGWQNCERKAFFERCKPSFISALALVHHLRITAGIPISKIAAFFKQSLARNGMIVIEFVPKHDNQVQRLLSHRDDIFFDYNDDNFVSEMINSGLRMEEEFSLPDNERKIYVFRNQIME